MDGISKTSNQTTALVERRPSWCFYRLVNDQSCVLLAMLLLITATPRPRKRTEDFLRIVVLSIPSFTSIQGISDRNEVSSLLTGPAPHDLLRDLTSRIIARVDNVCAMHKPHGV